MDRVGNVFIADTGHSRVVDVDTASNGDVLLNSVFLQGTTLSGPLGVALDAFGGVYVADTGDSRALVVDPFLGVNDPSSLNKTAVGFGHIGLGSSTPTSFILSFSVGYPVNNLGIVSAFTSGTQNLDFQIVSGANTTCNGAPSVTYCTVEVSFLPTAPGLRNGALVLYDPSSNPVLTVPLYGFGDAPVAALAPNTGTVISTGGMTLSLPFQIALDGAGNIYDANDGGNLVKIPAGGGSASVVSPTGYTFGAEVTGVALDGAGNLFTSDHENNRILVITPGGVASVLSVAGLSTALSLPTALAFDASGTLYIADYGNGRTVEVSSIQVAGSTSTGLGTVIGTGSYTVGPEGNVGVAVDGMGNIYITDGYVSSTDSSRIIKVTSAGAASLLTPTGITFNSPQGVGIDGMGNIYIADGGNNRIVELTAAGVTSVLKVGGLAAPAALGNPFGVTIDPFGNLYIPDTGNNRVVFVNVSGSGFTYANTLQGQTSSDSPQTATVTNLGDEPLVFSANPTYTANFSNNGNDTNLCTSSTSLASGTVCDVSINFTPQSVGALSAGIAVTDNTLNVAGSTQQVSVSGTGLTAGDTTSTVVTLSPASLSDGQTVTITATVSDTTSGHTTTVPTGPVTYTDRVGSTITALNGGAPVNLAAGTATLSGVPLSGIGTHTITANYNGVSSTYLASSGTATVTLAKASATIAGPSAQPVTVAVGQTGSVAIAITSPYTSIAAPSGTLNYNILNSSGTIVASGAVALATGSAGSTASIPIPSSLTSGSYTISVIYSGDANYQASSTPIIIQLRIGQVTPTISWTPAAGAITYGAALSGILDATALNGSTTIPGTFTYTATLAGGIASPVTNASVLGAGSYILTAQFTPTDPTSYGSANQTTAFTVNQASQTISFAAPASPVAYGAPPVTLIATGSASGNAVTFTVTGPATLSGNTLTFTGAGTVTVTATQAGNINYAAAAAVVHTIVVNQATPTIILSSAANPVLATNAVTFTAAIASAIGTPTGSVSFFDGTTLLGAGNLLNGSATFTTASLAAGTHAVTAVYSGDANFASITSTPVAEVVQDFTLGIASSGGSGGATQTVSPGGTAAYPLVLGPTVGTIFPSAITLSVSGLPPGATATIMPQTIPAGSPATNVTLSIPTAADDCEVATGESVEPANTSRIMERSAAALCRPAAPRRKRFEADSASVSVARGRGSGDGRTQRVRIG